MDSSHRSPSELKIDVAPVPEMLDKVVEKRRRRYVGYTPGCDGV